MRRTATTATALLGLLALRPRWSTWELTKQLRRNMRFFWPRAESRIYAQARQLEAKGLAQAERAHVGRRARTIYAITAHGQRALQRWLATPPRPTSLECEPLLRVMLADLGHPDQIRMAIDQVRADARAILDVGRVVGPEYLSGTAPFQDQIHVRAHVFDFLTHHAIMLLEWADRTEAATARWPAASPPERVSAAQAIIAAALAKFPAPPDRPPDRPPNGRARRARRAA